VKARLRNIMFSKKAQDSGRKADPAHQTEQTDKKNPDPNGNPTMTLRLEAAARFATVIDSFNESLERRPSGRPFV